MRKKYEIDESLTGAERAQARKRARYLANKEALIQEAKVYREVNKEKIKQQRAKRRDKEALHYKTWKEKYKKYIEEYGKEYRKNNAEKIKESKKLYYIKNKEKLLLAQKEYSIKNKDKIVEYTRKRYINIPEYYKAKANSRRAYKIQATREWDKELTDLVVIEAADLVKAREKSTGIKWHLDHIIPLRGKEVCGLHVWNNFRVIPAVENLRKSNKINFL